MALLEAVSSEGTHYRIFCYTRYEMMCIGFQVIFKHINDGGLNCSISITLLDTAVCVSTT